LVTLSIDASTCEALFVHIMDIPSKRGEDRALRPREVLVELESHVYAGIGRMRSCAISAANASDARM